VKIPPDIYSPLIQAVIGGGGRRIRELRGFDLTQKEFARCIGISQNYLSTMERGNVQIGSEILLKMSREFGKSIEWLLTGED
jgi:transcriptional regulator with XRE-family HTH domain